MPSDHSNRSRPRGDFHRLFRASGLVLVVAVAVFAVLLSGCNSTKTYSDPDYGFSFQYPGAWKLVVTQPDDLPTGVSKSVGALDQAGSGANNYGLDFVSVDIYAAGPDSGLAADTIQSEFEAWLEEAGSGDSTFRVAAAPTAVTVGGLQGFEATYTYTDGDFEVRCTEYWLLKGEVMYDLYTQATEDNWTDNQKTFDAFLMSFKSGDSD